MIYLNILLICIFWVCVSDIARFGESIEQIISRRKGKKVTLNKIFKCSLCQTWWTSLLYLIITSNLSILNITFTIFIAINSTIIKDVISLLQDAIIMITCYLRRLLIF